MWMVRMIRVLVLLKSSSYNYLIICSPTVAPFWACLVSVDQATSKMVPIAGSIYFSGLVQGFTKWKLRKAGFHTKLPSHLLTLPRRALFLLTKKPQIGISQAEMLMVQAASSAQDTFTSTFRHIAAPGRRASLQKDTGKLCTVWRACSAFGQALGGANELELSVKLTCGCANRFDGKSEIKSQVHVTIQIKHNKAMCPVSKKSLISHVPKPEKRPQCKSFETRRNVSPWAQPKLMHDILAAVARTFPNAGCKEFFSAPWKCWVKDTALEVEVVSSTRKDAAPLKPMTWRVVKPLQFQDSTSFVCVHDLMFKLVPQECFKIIVSTCLNLSKRSLKPSSASACFSE